MEITVLMSRPRHTDVDGSPAHWNEMLNARNASDESTFVIQRETRVVKYSYSQFIMNFTFGGSGIPARVIKGSSPSLLGMRGPRRQLLACSEAPRWISDRLVSARYRLCGG